VNNLEVIEVDIIGGKYKVYIGKNLIKDVIQCVENQTKNKNILIVTDEFFLEGYAGDVASSFENSGFSVYLYVMKGGKNSKTFNELLKIYGILEVNDFARDSTLIACGGGVIGDLAGFVASTWYRGMNLIHVPTTLMGMVDSSIGGKVAINFRQTINAVGNYYHPVANFMDTNFIDSLSERDYVSGIAEVIKCSLIADTDLMNYLISHRDNILKRDLPYLTFCIKRAIEIKVDHVKNDVREGGKRLLLNYGHTIGHAIEMATHKNERELFRHGEGVSLGISAALSISQSQLNLSNEVVGVAKSLLKSFRLPVEFSASSCGYDCSNLIDQCMELVLKDKKRKDNSLRFILVDELGHAKVYDDISEQQIKKALKTVIKK